MTARTSYSRTSSDVRESRDFAISRRPRYELIAHVPVPRLSGAESLSPLSRATEIPASPQRRLLKAERG